MPDRKSPLRTHFRRLRQSFVAALSPGEREALERQLAAIVAPLLTEGTAAYAATGAEIDPRHIPDTLLPRVSGKDLSFHRCPPEGLVCGTLKIPEPPSTTPRHTPNLLLMPLLAATPAGVRLGQGGGYYDRTLETLRRSNRILAIGLAWDVQITETLPHESWDQPLDYIATPTRLVNCAHNR